MSDVPVITYAWEGPKTALTLMKSFHKKVGYVVDKKQSFLGIITSKELERLLTLEEKFKSIPLSSIEKVDSVHSDVIIEELFVIAPKNHYAIPVVDEKNRLIGRITNDAIFDSISVDGGSND
jgi:Mg/Co/Ni transporter MgtE